jgi:hypothetical protein
VGLGAGATAAIMASMRALLPDWSRALQMLDSGQAQAAAGWIALLGGALGVLVAVRVLQPLATAVPVLLLLAFYGPFLADFRTPTWFPNWLASTIRLTVGPLPFLIIGLLLIVTLWRIIESRSSRTLL